MHMFQNGDCQCRSFGRIRSCTKLVKQHQTFSSHIFQNPDNVRHMTGERTETLLNALLVPDIRINGVKYTELTAIFSRNEQAGHRHQT
ncbi:hypothetical protein D3C76_1566520 [compost metagenome]